MHPITPATLSTLLLLAPAFLAAPVANPSPNTLATPPTFHARAAPADSATDGGSTLADGIGSVVSGGLDAGDDTSGSDGSGEISSGVEAIVKGAKLLAEAIAAARKAGDDGADAGAGGDSGSGGGLLSGLIPGGDSPAGSNSTASAAGSASSDSSSSGSGLSARDIHLAKREEGGSSIASGIGSVVSGGLSLLQDAQSEGSSSGGDGGKDIASGVGSIVDGANDLPPPPGAPGSESGSDGGSGGGLAGLLSGLGRREVVVENV